MTTGRKRHYIPQFLQRGFAISRKVSKSSQEIWRFGAGQSPSRLRIKDTGFEDFFYADQADEEISKSETDFSESVHGIRSRPPGESIDSRTAAAVVSHFAVRTAHVRSSLLGLMNQMVDGAKDFFANYANVAALLGLDGDEPSDLFNELVAAEVDKNPGLAVLGIPPSLFARVLFLHLKENPMEIREWLGVVPNAIKQLRSASTNVVSKSHDRALYQPKRPDDYEFFLRSLDWTAEEAPAAGAILPDCIVIAVGIDGVANTHFFIENHHLGAIVLAISTERILIGRQHEFQLPARFDFNTEAACLCHNFFLAADSNPETTRLHKRIGEQFGVSVKKGVQEAFENYQRPMKKPRLGGNTDIDRRENREPR